MTLDALGTLVELDRPVPRLVAELRDRGIEASEAQAAAALGEEIAYYRAHHDLGADAASLELLRARCADVLRVALQRAGVGVRGESAAAAVRDALLAALRFRAFDDVPAALAELRAAGHRLVVVSNWDVSLHDMLRTTGLDALVDGAISSAEAGARKPAPAIFQRALALAGAGAPVSARCTRGTRSPSTSRGRAGPGCGRCSSRARPSRRRVPDGVPVVRSLAGLAALAA